MMLEQMTRIKENLTVIIRDLKLLTSLEVAIKKTTFLQSKLTFSGHSDKEKWKQIKHSHSVNMKPIIAIP